MRRIRYSLVTIALAMPLPCVAQSAPSASPGVSAPADTAVPVKKKKGGLFGKVKGLAQNKTLQQVAKTAACNMVPGGQLVAGAIDAASAKKAAKNAAKDAATGAALGAVGGKNSTCAPGMGLAGKLTPAALSGGVPGVGVPGMPTTGMPAAGLPAKQLKQMREQYQEMGFSPEQIQAMQQQMTTAPVAGLSPEQIKQMEEQYRNMGMDPGQLEAMRQMMAGTPAGSPGPPPAAAPPGSPITASEAPSLSREKNRLVLRRLPWASGSEAIHPGSEPAFDLAMRNLVGSIVSGAKRYKVEVRVENQGSKTRSQQLAQKRAAAVVTALIAQGMPQNRLTAGGGGSDKDPRVVVSETK
jgi:hypothetical protein